MFKEAITKTYLRKKGADAIAHTKGGTLLDHLVRVERKLRSWGVAEAACRAALCHSIYSTDHFPQAIVAEQEREEVSMLIGEDAERIAWHFSRMDRETLELIAGSGSYVDRFSRKVVPLSEEDAAGLFHILIANELDHLTALSLEAVAARVNKYQALFPYLVSAAQEEVSELATEGHTDEVPRIVCTGHAGLWFKTNRASLVVDPWLYSSSFERPVLAGLGPGQRAIDYLIPRPVHTTAELSPQIVLFSHLHTHHSPLRELQELATKGALHIICPASPSTTEAALRAAIGEGTTDSITFHFCDKDTAFDLEGITIRAFTHTRPHHLGYHVSCDGLSFIHLADAPANHVLGDQMLADVWNKLADARPTALFISAANHSQRTIVNGRREILESTTFSPVQAAKLARLIRPRTVGLIGMQNFSIWDSLLEYTHSSQDIENEFRWALSYLQPSVRIEHVRPGLTITL